MSEDFESNLDRQKDELITLESICGEREFSFNLSGAEPIGRAEIKLLVPTDFSVFYDNPKTNKKETLSVSFLPPLCLYFCMPIEYPSQKPPKFTLSSCWLPRHLATLLCAELDNIWDKNTGDEILYTWIQFLKDDSFGILKITDLNICDLKVLNDSKNGSNISEPSIKSSETCFMNPIANAPEQKSFANSVNTESINSPALDDRFVLEIPTEPLISFLKEYNDKCLQEEFEKSSVYCDICCDTFAGSHCSRFCETHSFCNTCLKEYLITKIKDGSVKNISCPSNDCDSEASIILVKSLIPTELFATYEQILLTQTLDTMMDIIYCPRISCQYPVCYNPAETVASCPYCKYSFCIYCKRVYHGVEPCKLNSEERLAIIEKYINGTDEDRQAIDKKYGQKYMRKVLDEHASEETIASCTQACPHCKVHIEKSEGCHKMTCNRCQTFFCWLCSTILDKCNPYDHFSNPKSKCFNKLFPREPTEEYADDMMEDFRDNLGFFN